MRYANGRPAKLTLGVVDLDAQVRAAVSQSSSGRGKIGRAANVYETTRMVLKLVESR
jgi:hypothetical protein